MATSRNEHAQRPRVQYYVASTIDGFIADENDRLDWLLQFGFETFQARYDEFMSGIGAIIMGSTTYEYILDQVDEPWAYRSMPVFVLTSRQLTAVPDADIRFHRGDVATVHSDAIRAAAGKNVWLMGGGNVAAQFADRGLLDELLLTIVPVLLGSGKPVLPVSGATSPLRLVHTTPFPNGAIELVHRLGTD